MVRRIGLLTLGAAVGLTLSACSDDHGPDGDAEPASTSPTGGVTVIAEDIALDEPTYRAQAGAVDITYRNEGNIEHTLVIEGVDGFKLDVPANGDVDQASVDLQPGQYTLYCDIQQRVNFAIMAMLEEFGTGFAVPVRELRLSDEFEQGLLAGREPGPSGFARHDRSHESQLRDTSTDSRVKRISKG